MAVNATVKVDSKKIMTITVDLKKEFGLSKSGKSITIATTSGNMDVPGADGVKLGLNVYRRA